MIDGRTVMEIDPYCKSAQEVSELWQYLDRRLMRAEGGYRQGDEPAGAAQTAAQNRVFGRRAAQ